MGTFIRSSSVLYVDNGTCPKGHYSSGIYSILLRILLSRYLASMYRGDDRGAVLELRALNRCWIIY